MTTTFYCHCFLSADTDPRHDENSEVGQLQTRWRKELQQRHALMQPGVMKMASVLGKDAADGTSQSTGEVLWLRARQPRGKELSHERSTETRLVGKRNSHVFSHFHKDTNSSASSRVFSVSCRVKFIQQGCSIQVPKPDT